jgi:hypothetical protein
MLVALGTLASAQTKSTEATATAVTQLLNYCATHPDAILRYHASDMILHVHSDASYLSERNARSRAGGLFFLSTSPLLPTATPLPDATPPPLNGAIHVHSSIMSVVLSSATEAELGALFFNGKEAAMLRTTLADMGHPQPATPIQTDNACAAGITNGTVKQRRSKAMDMRFYWIRDRVKQGQFLVHWRRGTDNLADYFTKHHSPAHHQYMRSRYLLALHHPEPSPSPSTVTTSVLRGCVDSHRLPVGPSTEQPTQDVSQSQPISAGLNNPTIHDTCGQSNDIPCAHPLFIQQSQCRTPMPFTPKQVLAIDKSVDSLCVPPPSSNRNKTSVSIIQNE